MSVHSSLGRKKRKWGIAKEAERKKEEKAMEAELPMAAKEKEEENGMLRKCLIPKIFAKKRDEKGAINTGIPRRESRAKRSKGGKRSNVSRRTEPRLVSISPSSSGSIVSRPQCTKTPSGRSRKSQTKMAGVSALPHPPKKGRRSAKKSPSMKGGESGTSPP